MGKKSGITKAGRNMNPADRERKQQRAKELKRNKKQRVQVRHAIVKSRNPDEIIEALSRLDDQEFEPGRQLSLNVIQEKRNKLKGSYYQIIGLCRQEKDERKVKNLERMMFEYEVERARKEENYRAQQFSQEANFDEIPLPSGISIPEAASTPYSSNSGAIGPQIPGQMQAAMKAGILKKTTAKKQHKHPPGPPPGLPPSLTDSEEEEDEEGSGWPDERRKRVRFGEPPSRRARDDFQEEYEDEDYAPVEIPDGMFGSDQPPPQQQPIYSRPVPSLAAPAIGSGPIMPGMAPPPPAHPQYPTGYSMHSSDRMRGSQVQAVQQATIGYTPDPHPSAIISAGPQVVKPSVEEPQSSASGEAVISAAPQMRNIKREATRFVPTAVKIGKPVVPTVIGPKIPTSSVAGPTKLLPRSQTKSKPKPTGQSTAGGGMKSVDEACDEFLKELDGLL